MAGLVEKLLLVTLSMGAGLAIGSHPAFIEGVLRRGVDADPAGPPPTDDCAPSLRDSSATPFDAPGATATANALDDVDASAAALIAGQVEPSSDYVVSFLAGLDLPDLPVRQHTLVLHYLRFFTSTPEGRRVLSQWMSRRGRYHDEIASELERLALPRSLEAVAFVESGLWSQAQSPAGAVGLWQLMPATARAYGLRVDQALDERTDPARSTRAGVRHLGYLYRTLASWDLALAAYNAGLARVSSAMARGGTNDFWSLDRPGASLPEETLLYVPKVLAVATVLTNLERFGFDDPSRAAATVPRLVAADESLFPIPGADGGFELVRQLEPTRFRPEFPLPAEASGAPGTVLGYSWMSDAPAPRRPTLENLSHRVYQVAPGDTLSEIAALHGLTLRQLVRDNDINDPALVRIGQKLRIRSSAPAGSSAPNLEQAVGAELAPTAGQGHSTDAALELR